MKRYQLHIYYEDKNMNAEIEIKHSIFNIIDVLIKHYELSIENLKYDDNNSSSDNYVYITNVNEKCNIVEECKLKNFFKLLEQIINKVYGVNHCELRCIKEIKNDK